MRRLRWSAVTQRLSPLWASQPALTAVGLLHLAVLPFCAWGLVADERLVGGAAVWLKPAKFAFSGGVFALTLAAMMSYVHVWRWWVQALSWLVALSLAGEVALIFVQAGRGTASHFNVSTPLDAALFSAMGVGISLIWLGSLGLAAALCRQRFDDRAWGWSLKLGLLVGLLGIVLGGALMLRPTGAQLATMRARLPVTTIGAHTAGAPDGGPGLPVTGWSRTHGDHRAAHFLALHAMQVLPFIGLWATRRSRRPLALVLVATASYVALFALLQAQALAGVALLQPDRETALRLLAWALVTAVAVGVTLAPAGAAAASPALGLRGSR